MAVTIVNIEIQCKPTAEMREHSLPDFQDGNGAGKFEVKACYEFIRDYYGEWFPDLPSCQVFNNRVCCLADAFKALASALLQNKALPTPAIMSISKVSEHDLPEGRERITEIVNMVL